MKLCEFGMAKTQKKIKIEKVKKSFLGSAKGIGSFTKEDKRWMEGKRY